MLGISRWPNNFWQSLSEHNKNLIEVFQRLREINLKINFAKYSFLRKNILYLGDVILKNGLSPDSDKCTAIRELPTPKNAENVRRFVSFANFIRIVKHPSKNLRITK